MEESLTADIFNSAKEHTEMIAGMTVANKHAIKTLKNMFEGDDISIVQDPEKIIEQLCLLQVKNALELNLEFIDIIDKIMKQIFDIMEDVAMNAEEKEESKHD